jgi:histone acetyltransferase (RNA polymerase elongator complex component)
LNPDGVRIYPTVVIKDTVLYDMWKEGSYKEHSVEDAIALCAELFLLFSRKQIPVIRMGLNPTAQLSGGDAVAGAYHPAFGELVYARIFLNKARILLQTNQHGAAVLLGVHKSRVSVMTGHKKSNIESLKREFGLSELRIRQADVETNEIVLL